MAKKYKYFTLQTEMMRKGESQADVARLLKITANAVRNKLDCRNEWTINEIDTLCNHYNMNYYDLFKKE